MYIYILWGDILSDKWSPALQMRTVLLSIQVRNSFCTTDRLYVVTPQQYDRLSRFAVFNALCLSTFLVDYGNECLLA